VSENARDDIQSAVKGLKLRILPLGDSITFGIGSTGLNGYRKDLLQQLTAAGATVEYVGNQKSGNFPQNNNEGWSGYTISQISNKADKGLAFKPNVVCLMGGTNDQSFGDPKSAPSKIQELAKKIITTLPDAVLVIGTLTPLNFGKSKGGIEEFNAALPGIVESLASKGGKVVMANFGAIKSSDLKDGVHPNDGGYTKMATAWFQAIDSASAKGWIKSVS
jgi:lysophospholipase L1-like esterase